MPPARTPRQPDLRTRLRWCSRFRAAIAADIDTLATLAEREIGKPPIETITADLYPVMATCARLGRRAGRVLRGRRLGGTPMWLPGVRVRVERAPLGTVGIIATWNYPVGLLGVQLAQAVVAGNRVIVTPSERAPETQTRLLELAAGALDAVGMPAGTIRVAPAEREAGEALAASEEIDHLVFTGSTDVGRKIASSLAPRLVTSELELSGRDSALVLADADPKLAARVLVTTLNMNAGQTCMAPRRVLVAAEVFDAFCAAATDALRDLPPRPMIDGASADHCRSLHAEALARGGRDLHPAADLGDAQSMRPAMVVTDPEDTLGEGRHFGPLCAVVRVASLDEAIAAHRRCDQHLATSVFTRSPRAHAALPARLGVTTVTFNDCIIPTAHPGAAIGGLGPSGWGVTQGDAGLLALTRPVHVSRTHPLVRIPPKPPEPAQAGLLARSARLLYGRNAPRGGPSTATLVRWSADSRSAHTDRANPVQEPS